MRLNNIFLRDIVKAFKKNLKFGSSPKELAMIEDFDKIFRK